MEFHGSLTSSLWQTDEVGERVAIARSGEFFFYTFGEVVFP